MLDCREMNEVLPLYIDGLLDENKKSDFEKHIESCKACSQELSEFRMLVDVLHDLPDEELPDNFSKELHEKLLLEADKQQKPKLLSFFRKPYYKVLSTVAAGVLVIFLAKGIYDINSLQLNKATESADESGAVQTEEAAQFRTFKAESADYGGENNENLQMSIASQAEQPSAEIKAAPNKNAAESSRADGVYLRGTGISSKSASLVYRNIEIIVYTEKQKEKYDEIITMAQDFSAELLKEDDLVTDSDSAGSTVVNFKISDSVYEDFIEDFKDALGSDEAIFSPLNEDDRSDEMFGYRERLTAVNDRIMQLNNEKSAEAQTELESLKKEQLSILTEINSIEQDSQFIFVKIIINEKKV